MKRTNTKQPVAGNPLRRAADRLKRMFSKGDQPSAPRSDAGAVDKAIATMNELALKESPLAIHRPRAKTDVPLDEIASRYQPAQTSLKASFRTDGADHQRDQDVVDRSGDETWRDEDRFTNKSGDPRIGTHGRTYEPGERISPKKTEEDS